jgi:putative redox protein
MDIEISFPGGLRVDAEVNGHTIRTDQSREVGGEGSAPEPYLLFLASLGTCAGIYALRFCQSRGIPTKDLKIVQRHRFNTSTGALEAIELQIRVPQDFPEKYYEALMRAADKCAVKRTLFNPPQINVKTVAAE